MDKPKCHCPDCQCDDFTTKATDFPVTIGNTTLLVAVQVAECDQCGYQLLDMDNASILDAAYARLQSGDLSGLTPVGTVYRQ